MGIPPLKRTARNHGHGALGRTQAAANQLNAFRRNLIVPNVVAIGAGLIFFLLVWQGAYLSAPVGPTRIPSPTATFHAFTELLLSGTILKEAGISVTRVLVGFSAAALLGTPLGLICGAFWHPRQFVSPTFSFLRYIPPTAFLSLLVIYLGISEIYKYAVVFLGIVFFLFQMSMDVARSVPRAYLEMAISEGMSAWEAFRRVVVPFSLPRLIPVLRINLSGAWTFIVAAEIVGAQEGLGYFISKSQRFFRTEDVFVGILSFGLIGLVSDSVLTKLGGMLFRWYWAEVEKV